MDSTLTAVVAASRIPPGQEDLWPLSADDRLFLSSGLSSFYSELMKGLGAGGRLWELMERQPRLPFNGGYAVGLSLVLTDWHSALLREWATAKLQLLLQNREVGVPMGP